MRRESYGKHGNLAPPVVKDIEPLNGTGHPRSFVEYQGQLYFVCGNQAGFNDDRHDMVWRSDGTVEETVSAIDFRQADEEIFIGWLTAMGEDLYMVVESGDASGSLWRSDGTKDGSSLILEGGVEEIVAATSNRLFFHPLR